jgi:hypothetical protein
MEGIYHPPLKLLKIYLKIIIWLVGGSFEYPGGLIKYQIAPILTNSHIKQKIKKYYKAL